MAVPKFLLPFATAFALALVGAIRLTIAGPGDDVAAKDAASGDAVPPATAKPDVSNSGSNASANDVVLAEEQAKLSQKYKELERVVLRMAEVMQSSDPRRAALLRQAFAQSRERQIGTQFDELVKLLQTDQLYQASKGQTAVDQDLNRLLLLLMSGDRDRQIPNDRAEIKRFIERINKLIREQQGIEGETEGQGDPADLANRQEKLANRTTELAKDLHKFDERNNPNAKDPSNADNADGKDADGKDGDAKDAGGKKADGKKSDGKKSDGKKADGKDSDAKNADGKDGDNQKGENGTDGEKSDSEKSGDKKGDAKSQSKSGSKQGAKNSKNGKSDAQKSDDQSGENAEGDADSEQKGGEKSDGKSGSQKSGVKKSDGKKSGGKGEKSDAKNGEKGDEKKADDQNAEKQGADGKSGEKSGGEKSDKGSKSGKKGSDGKSGKSGQKSNQKDGGKDAKSEDGKSDAEKSDDQKSDDQKADGEKSGGQKSGSKSSKSGSKSGQKSQKGSKGSKDGEQSDEQSDPQNGDQQQDEQSSDEPPARKQIRQAEDRMRDAKRKLEEAERRGAAADQQKAIEELKQAKAALEEILRQLREEEVERVLAMLEGRFRKMLQLQVEVYEGTIALDRIPEEERDRNTEIEAGKLSKKEANISTEADKTLTLLREEGSSVAFPESVEQLREDMDQVTARLGRANIGSITQGVEQDIVKSLEEMVAALQKAQEKEQQKGAQQKGGKKGNGGQQQDKPLVNAIAELKMIRALQMRVNTRTERYSKLLADGTEQAEAPDLVEAVKRLSEREERIHKTTRDIVVGRNK